MGKKTGKRGVDPKPCDGTANDYRRHKKNGTPVCASSRAAWRVARRKQRKTGLWVGTIPYVPLVDDNYKGRRPNARIAD